MALELIDTLAGSGTWTVPVGCLGIYVYCWGKGGNGSYPSAYYSGSGGGGGGHCHHTTYRAVTPGSTISWSTTDSTSYFGISGDAYYCYAKAGSNAPDQFVGGSGGGTSSGLSNVYTQAGSAGTSNSNNLTFELNGGAAGGVAYGGGAAGKGNPPGGGGWGARPGTPVGSAPYYQTGGGEGQIWIYKENSLGATDNGDMFAMF